MNRLSHMMFALSLYVLLYSLIFGYSVWSSDVGRLTQLLSYFLAGGVLLMIITVPIAYVKAPHKDSATRTTSNKGAISALSFVFFSIGSLGGSGYYMWTAGIPIVGSLSLTMGALIMILGALVADWDIPLLGISRHRNLVFHSAILPLLIAFMTLVNVTLTIAANLSFQVGVQLEYYITALFLLGYASHLYLDIFPSSSSPLEIVWRASDPHSKAPTGIRSFGPFKISKNAARGWLVLNASVLVIIAFFLMGLYFYNLFASPPSP
ncbi:MAG: hypothetical protein ACTSYL_12070 [Candidatus Thorarchaeota archaeon]